MMNALRFLAALACCAAAAVAQQSPTHDDQARFLAGLPVRGSALEHYSTDPLWMEHATGMDQRWGKQEQRQLSKARSWSQMYLSEHQGGGAVFYMFSGPDALYPHAFFPNADTYILCGTEPVGAVPDVTRVPRDHLALALASLRQSMKTMLSFHYFITKEMRVDLQRGELGGTLPIIYVFLARSGNVVHDATFLNKPAPGVKVTFSRPGGKRQTLYYFKTDLSNGGGSGAFFRFCASHGKGLSVVKAASYLMHQNNFSTVRDFLLQNSRVIVQDDSGIPMRGFEPGRWTVRLFGSYTGPIELFAKHYQPDLAQAYLVRNPGPLGFAFGYHWQPQKGMLMVATPK